MNQPAHTPGPWHFDPKRFNSPGHDDKSGSIISDLDDWFVAEICGDCNRHKANARLIAAAPDLLSCLKAAEQDLRLVAAIFEQKDIPLTAEELRNRVATYAAAIAKAEGKA